MATILAADPKLMQQIGDLWFRNQDFPGAEVIADRLAAINPMAQIDEKSPVPPQVQMQMAMGKAQLQKLQQENAQLQMMIKQRQDIEGVKQEAETKRELMRQHTKAHDTEMRVETTAQDTIIKTQTQLQIEELKAQLALVLAHINKTTGKEAQAEAVERAI